MERRQADAAASRAESAAALTEEYTRRVVEALERIAAAPTATGSAVAPAPRVRWKLAHHAGDTYVVENVADLTAENVRVTAHDSMMFDAPEPQDLGPGEAVTFLAVRTMGTSDSTITVTGSSRSGTEEVWRYPPPDRPPR